MNIKEFHDELKQWWKDGVRTRDMAELLVKQHNFHTTSSSLRSYAALNREDFPKRKRGWFWKV